MCTISAKLKSIESLSTLQKSFRCLNRALIIINDWLYEIDWVTTDSHPLPWPQELNKEPFIHKRERHPMPSIYEEIIN